MKKLLFLIASVSILMTSCNEDDTCDRLLTQRYNILYNADNLKADDQLRMLQQTDSMIMIFCNVNNSK